MGSSWTPRSGHAGWRVRHRERGDTLYMRVFAAMCADNLTRAAVCGDTHRSPASTQAVKAPLHPCQALNPRLDAADMGEG